MRFRLLTSLVLCLTSLPLSAQSIVADARERLQNDIRNSNIGAGYAQMLNFFANPSVSASRLEADDNTKYDVIKVPIQYEFPAYENGWRLALRGTLSHASAENDFTIFGSEKINGKWEADSALIGAGLSLPIDERLSWHVGGQFGISRLENEAKYRGAVGEALAPILDGILFNWDTNARIGSLTGGVKYRTRLADRYALDINARYTHSHIKSYSESRSLQSFSENTGTLAATADLEHPYAGTAWDLPLFGVVHAGATAFTGPNRDALGFTHFYSIGYSMGLDVTERSRYFEGFTLGAQYSFGKEVDGFSLIFGWRLK